jgi:4-amino-4-deoxy-L-arabinose transferase-like glycosyltransferase
LRAHDRQLSAVLSPRRERFLLALILLVAVLVRLYRLDDVPPGLTHDEAANGMAAIGVLEGERPLYFTVGNGREPLYAYSLAPVIAVLGAAETSVRLTSALWGLALILVTWAWVRHAFDPVTALLAAGGLSVGFWPLMVSRLGLRAVTLPVLFTLSVYFLWHAIDLSRKSSSDMRSAAWRRYIMAGLLLGGSFYTYMASRVLPAVLLFFSLYLALIHRRRARSFWLGILTIAIVAIVVAVPLIQYLSAHPGAETRIEQLVDPWRRARAGDWQPLQQNVLAAFQIFTFNGAGDPHWMYNISGRPLLDPVSGLLFFVGVLLTLWRWRDPAHFFSLLWLVVGLVPVLVTGANSSTLRAVAIQPVVFVMQALAIKELADNFRRRSLYAAYYLLPGLLLLIIAVITVQVYFDGWPNERDVRVAYHTTLVEIARYLDVQPDGGTVAISSIYPNLFHDPYSFAVTSHRDDLDARWFDGRFSLLLPDVDEAFVVFPALAPLDASLTRFFSQQAQLLDRVVLRDDDLNPWFDVYKWHPVAARAGLPLITAWDFGRTVTFIGHQLLTTTIVPGGTVELLTFWRVQDSFQLPYSDTELVLFTHALDATGKIVGQQDRLDVPAWNWSQGDILIQLHRFDMDDELKGGFYPLEVGVYSRTEDGSRLPVFDPENASSVGDSILLPPVEVRAP